MKRLVSWGVCAVVLAGCTSLSGPGGRTMPAGLHTDCANAVVVGLRWDPPPGRAWWRRSPAYPITRNGSPLGTTSETNFVDTTVTASTTYSYSVGAVGTLEVTTPAASPSGDAPYCKSRYIDSITFDWAGGHTEPNGSDLWPVTWGKDGNVYTFFGDGGGFGGDNWRGRVSFGVAMISAPPPLSTASVKNIYGGFQAAHPSTIDGKAGTIIAVGNDFYTLGGLWNAHDLQGVTKHKSGAPKRIQLGYSKGNAHSWRAASWNFCSGGPETAVGAFCPGRFVNYGRGNSGAPDGFVYLMGIANSPEYWADDDGPEVRAELGRTATAAAAAKPPDTIATTHAANTYLARVAKRHVLQHEAYRYFAGTDARGRPLWSADFKQMQPVFTDRNPNRTQTMEGAVYNPGLHRYIATAQGEYVGEASFYDAPQLWGPWTTLSYNNIDPKTGGGGWGNLGKAGGGSLGVHIVNAWTSADGLSLWMTYSSDGKAPPDSLFPPPGTMLDSFNLLNARLIPATAPGKP